MKVDSFDQQFGGEKKSLALRSYRTTLLASNIANADTPNYKAVDFDFGAALKSATSGNTPGLEMSKSDPRHLDGKEPNDITASAHIQYRSAVQPSIDGNTVDMDVERAAFADNALRYQTTLTFMNRHMSNLNDAIKG